MARLQDAIVHSSMQVPPCQPKISMSAIEKPIVASADRRVISPSTSAVPAINSAALNRMMAG